MGNIASIPLGHLPLGNREYDGEMPSDEQNRLYAARRNRLRFILTEGLLTQTKLAELLDMEANYVSRMVSDGPNRKNIGEATARAIERAAGKPKGWLDHDGEEIGTTEAEHRSTGAWPFDFDRHRYDRLAAADKIRVESAALTMVIEIERKHRKRRRRRESVRELQRR